MSIINNLDNRIADSTDSASKDLNMGNGLGEKTALYLNLFL